MQTRMRKSFSAQHSTYRRPREVRGGGGSLLGIRVNFPEEVTFRACRTLETLKAAMICRNVMIVELQVFCLLGKDKI